MKIGLASPAIIHVFCILILTRLFRPLLLFQIDLIDSAIIILRQSVVIFTGSIVDSYQNSIRKIDLYKGIYDSLGIALIDTCLRFKQKRLVYTGKFFEREKSNFVCAILY